MDTSALIKVGLPWETSGSKCWDDGGRTVIARIYIYYNSSRIDAIQFIYVENGEFVMGEKHGKNDSSDQFAVVEFDHPSEVLTCLHGSHHFDNFELRKTIRSVSCVTNKGTYGPFGFTDYIVCGRKVPFTTFGFRLGDGSSFAGFHGTLDGSGRLDTIGVYISPPAMIEPKTQNQVP